MSKIYTSYLVTDGERVGEVFATDASPYDGSTPAAYVVGNGWADWIALDSLARVNATAEAEATAA